MVGQRVCGFTPARSVEASPIGKRPVEHFEEEKKMLGL
jgi:hypothetical protein